MELCELSAVIANEQTVLGFSQSEGILSVERECPAGQGCCIDEGVRRGSWLAGTRVP